MRTYIIFTPEITSMGGAQMYTANKIGFLRSKGWNVQVFFPKMKGEILIPELKEFRNNLIQELDIPLRFMTQSMKNTIFEKVRKASDLSDDIVMESQIITTSFLVEEIAEYIGARHIINSLDEKIPIVFVKQHLFFEYKLKRWEFQNASEKHLKKAFGKYYKEDFLAYENAMVYKCSNVVSDNEDKTYSFSQADYTVLSIGRLDKPYILPMTDEIALFANKHQNITINVLYVGGSFSGEYESKIEAILGGIKNVNLYMLGYTFPVPKTVIDAADVAIACANSVNVTADMDIPTIVADINDYMAIGVYGYDTQNKFARVTEPPVPISMLLESVLLDNKYPSNGFLTDTMSDANEAFERELTFIEKSKGNTGYYDIESFIPLKTRLLSRLVWWKYQFLEPSKLDPRKRF